MWKIELKYMKYIIGLLMYWILWMKFGVKILIYFFTIIFICRDIIICIWDYITIYRIYYYIPR